MNISSFAGTALVCLPGAMLLHAATTAVRERWRAEHANQWYARPLWIVGANYIPSDAINELEMFQAVTFNPALNGKELGMAESIGMDMICGFLQDQLWKQNTEGFKGFLNTFLSIAVNLHIQPILVLFDSCWGTGPSSGNSFLRPRESITPDGFKARAAMVESLAYANAVCRHNVSGIANSAHLLPYPALESAHDHS